MTPSLKTWGRIFVKSVKKFFDENSFLYSAGIAFYTIFSLPGIAIITVYIAGSFLHENEKVTAEFLKQISLLIGPSSADQVETILDRQLFTDESLILKIIGVVVLLISTTTVFISLQNILNSIWKIKPKPEKMVLRFLLNRLITLAMVAFIGFVLMVSLTMDTLVAVLQNIIEQFIGDKSYYFILIINYMISLGITVLIFASVYKVLPDAKIKWKDVWLGAVSTTVFFTIGKLLIAFYLKNSDVSDAYGAAGSLVVLLSWVYYSVLKLIFGAQFTYTYINEIGRNIKPTKGAVSIKVVEVEEQ